MSGFRAGTWGGRAPASKSFGVPYAWLVHPRRRTLEAFRLHEGKWLAISAYKDTDRARIEPFDAIEFDLAVLWADAALPTRASEEPEQYRYESY